MASLDLTATNLDIKGHAGDDLTLTITVVDSASDAVDVSSYTITATVDRDGTTVETFTDAVSGAGSNVITLSLTDTQTTTIGSSYPATWSLSMTTGTDTRQWLGGSFRLYPTGSASGGTSTSTTLSYLAASGTLTLTAAVAAGAGAGGGIASVAADTTPQLGGDLDVNGSSIVSTANGDITIAPNGTGNIVLGTVTLDADQTVGAGQDNYVLTYDNGTGLLSLEAAAAGSGTVDTSGTPVANDIARFTDADTIEGRSYAELKSDLSLVIGTDVQAWSAALDAVSGTNTGDEVAASATASGVVELATIAETDTGTDATRAVTPAGLAGSALQTKVDGVEAGATADQTGAQIKVAYEGEADTNAYTDAAAAVVAATSGTNTGDEVAASATASGTVELATIAEVDTGTDTVRAITPAGLAGSALQTKVDGIEAGADVTDTTNVTAAGALMDSEVDADIKTLVLPANTTITAFAATVLDDADAAAARTTLGAGTLSNLSEDTSPTLGGTLDANAKSIENLGAVEEQVNTVATTGATETLDTSLYGVHDCTMDQNCTFTFSNPAPSGDASSFVLILRGAFTPTLPASVDWSDATAPTYTTPSVYVFTTVDAGTTWLGAQVGKAFA